MKIRGYPGLRRVAKARHKMGPNHGRARVDRRLAAILAADVVGYSALMERDEDRTLARLKAHRQEFIEPLIAEYQGRVVKLMGDGALVEFASVVDAVRCAVLIQQGMAEREAEVPEAERIRFRIGINLGDVIHEADGDLYGDGVNVAARLEQLAEPGGVVVSGTAYDQLQGKLDLPLEFAGEQRVKNIERLVRAYRVRLDGTAAGSARRSAGSVALRRRRLAALLCSSLAVAVGAGGGGWPSERSRPPLPTSPRSRCCRSTTSAATSGSAGSPTAWPRTSSPICPARELFVIARGTELRLRNKPHDVRQVGRELGVRYVLEGSLEGDGERMRSTAQLVDAAHRRACLVGALRPAARRPVRGPGRARSADRQLDRRYDGAIRRAQLETAGAKPPQSLQALTCYCWRAADVHATTRRRTQEPSRAGQAGDGARPGLRQRPTCCRRYAPQDHALGAAGPAAMATYGRRPPERPSSTRTTPGRGRSWSSATMDSADFPRFASELGGRPSRRG